MTEPVIRFPIENPVSMLDRDVVRLLSHNRYFVIDRDATPVAHYQIRVCLDKIDLGGGSNPRIIEATNFMFTVTNLTDQFSGDIIFSSYCSQIITPYGVYPSVGVAPRGTVTIHMGLKRGSIYTSGDVMIGSVPESHVQHVSNDDFKQLVQSVRVRDTEVGTLITQLERKIQSVRVRDTELTGEIECLKVQNAKLVSEIEGLKNLFQEIQVKNVVTESMFVKKFDELCDVVEDVIDQNTSLRIQTQTTTARRNPFDE